MFFGLRIDFFHAEKERTAGKDEQIHKMTTISTEDGSMNNVFKILLRPKSNFGSIRELYVLYLKTKVFL